MKVMVDLETLSSGHNAVILSIGACTLDHEGVERREFYNRVDAESHESAGGRVSAGTALWWADQSDDARREITRSVYPALHVNVALLNLADWYKEVGGTELWGNGADFDCVVLDDAYRLVGIKKPWSFRDHRCFRTLKSLFPHVAKPAIPGNVKHHALFDAKSQAAHAEQMLDRMRQASRADELR